ncbi:MAG: methyltransferase domain-containing protein [Anaerolineae bacterium]|nr:methyltransferase domain-containing protein [Anaerolineae bacterium]
MGSLSHAWWGLVRFGFRLLYNEMAFTYDLVSSVVSLGSWRCWQRAVLNHLEIPKDGIVLELAHGTGNLQIDLHAAGYQHCIGYDLSPYMGRIAQMKLHRLRLPVKLVRGRAQQLPFSEARFDAVISTFPTDFIVAPETLQEVHRVLKPEGQFIIVPNGILTGGGAVEGGLEWLYRITGQRGGEPGRSIDDFLRPYGFTAEVFTERCPRSVAQVIVARKRDIG